MERNAYMKKYRSAYQGGEGEIVEKKSRFIATVQPVESEEEALAFVASMKKKYWNATHNCSAFVVGEHMELQRCSDDGEPSGTAGKPILEVIRGQELHDVLIVVTRYFGGTLLGTGGLVRAYTLAAQEGLALSNIITKINGVKLRIETDYTGLGKIQYLLGQCGIPVFESEYTEKVQLTVLIPVEEEKKLTSEIIEATNGQAVVEWEEMCSYADIQGKIILF